MKKPSLFVASLCAGLWSVGLSLHAGDPVTLFGGSDLSAWTMDSEGAWVAKDGELQPAEGGKGYAWTKETYGDFKLTLEFKMSKDCNSGVFFRTDPKNPVQGGFEIQVMDSAAKSELDKHDCGALYDALAPSTNAAKPAGEWNTMSITCKGPMVTVVLNGKTVVEANLDQWTTAGQNPDGSQNKFKTALKDLPRDNHIGLQNHGHPVWYRNIKVERL
ncbi:MAG: DUF1080 domain-containing protein [Verrucomicrobiae bacterium]|nr:DUF1080 domain-containing protein [Verrucomicrobiae bacterium]